MKLFTAEFRESLKMATAELQAHAKKVNRLLRALTAIDVCLEDLAGTVPSAVPDGQQPARLPRAPLDGPPGTVRLSGTTFPRGARRTRYDLIKEILQAAGGRLRTRDILERLIERGEKGQGTSEKDFYNTVDAYLRKGARPGHGFWEKSSRVLGSSSMDLRQLRAHRASSFSFPLLHSLESCETEPSAARFADAIC